MILQLAHSSSRSKIEEKKSNSEGIQGQCKPMIDSPINERHMNKRHSLPTDLRNPGKVKSPADEKKSIFRANKPKA